MLNRIDLMGRLTADPDLRKTSTGKSVASFNVAVERDYQGGGAEKATDFVNCVIWNQGAEFLSAYFRKGQMIALSGRLQSRKWEDREGKKRTEWEVIADNIYFCGDKPKTSEPTLAEMDDDDDELPF